MDDKGLDFPLDALALLIHFLPILRIEEALVQNDTLEGLKWK